MSREDPMENVLRKINEYLGEASRRDEINSDVPASSEVALMIRELCRNGFKMEYQFEALNTMTVLNGKVSISWKDEFVRSMKATGQETDELVVMLNETGFTRQSPGVWVYTPEPKKLKLPK